MALFNRHFNHFKVSAQVKRNESKFDITAVIQPVGNKDIWRIPIQKRYNKWIKIHTSDDIVEGDIVGYKNQFYEIHSIQNWGEFYDCLAILLD